MSYNLRRISDGIGDSGSMSRCVKKNIDGAIVIADESKPTIGYSIMVGSLTARSYSESDYWVTTTIVEILEEIENEKVHYIRFKTRNSEYEWWNGTYPSEKKSEINIKA